MKILPALLLLSAAAAADPAPLAWTLEPGASVRLTIDSARESSMVTDKDPIVTQFRMHAAGTLTVDSVDATGTAAVTFTFAEFSGVIAAFGFESKLDPEKCKVEGKSVKGTLTPRGKLVLDRKALHGIVEAHDISEEFTDLFPSLPESPVEPRGTWTQVESDREETWTLGEDGSALEGTCKADRQADLGETKTSYVAKGTMSATYDRAAGRYSRVAVEWEESSSLTGKDTRLVTGMKLKRSVLVEPAGKR